MNTELRDFVNTYAKRRALKLTAAVDEIAFMLSCSRAIMYKWMDGQGQPSAWQQLIISMLTLPRGVCLNQLTYPNPADDDLEENSSMGEIARRQYLAAAAMAGIAVHQVPFDRAAYDQWRGSEADTKEKRKEWADMRACGKA